MEKILRPSFVFAVRTYSVLTKPGIIFGNVVTAAGGFALASKGSMNFSLFFAMLLGLSLIVASACVSNNYIDRELDAKMDRTKNRAFPRGLIAPQKALVFAGMLGVSGTFLLASINLLTVITALLGLVVYVLFYTFLKYRTVHGTLIGSVAGAVPPVVGYAAVTNHLDLGALILFIMIAMWQMPHFFAITIYRLEDYAKASMPVLPIKKGMRATKVQMLFYTFAFALASLLLPLFNYTGYAYLFVAALAGACWLWLCIRGFKCPSDKVWARQMFFASLIIVTVLCAAIPFTIT